MNVNFFFFFFALYAEIQDGCQKWQENNFRENSSVDSADTRRIKYFVEIPLSRTVSEISVFLCFTKFKMAAKNGRKTFWGKKNRSILHCY